MFNKGSNMREVLRDRAARNRDKVAFTFLADKGEVVSWTYGELDCRARIIAGALQEIAEAGDRALLLYPSGLEYIAAFFACSYAGLIPVPVYPPQGSSNNNRLLSIVNDSRPTVALTLSSIRASIDSTMAGLNSNALQSIETDKLGVADGFLLEAREPLSDGHGLSFLQYTSGSTASPKGVMVSHSSLMHNLYTLQEAYEHSEDTVFISWLPIYHDMGLIGTILSSVYVGGHCVFMSPASFVKGPIRWLEAISRYGGTFSVAPNFGYDLCLERVTAEQKQGLDLSRWKVAVNGSEPVRFHTQQEFLRAFGPCGLPVDSSRPSYGLAEGTLMVTASLRRAAGPATWFDAELLKQNRVLEVPCIGEKECRILVSCGQTHSSQSIKIVDPETLTGCLPDQVGEIWFAGPSVCSGYWDKQELSASVFRAYTRDTGEGPFLRTGDLGFLHGGDLYIAGRLKDLIIIRGRNHHAQDIEMTVEQSHPAIRPSGVAAFSVESEGAERLVVVCEVKRSELRTANQSEIAHSIRAAVGERHDLDLLGIELIKPASLPKTSSGKVQRGLCRKSFLRGTLEGLQQNAHMVTPGSGQHHSMNGRGSKPLEFSLFYFASNEAEFEKDKYRLLLEGAKFADQNGFAAVWVPERHFHAFGGIFPNPCVLASALAMITKRIRIRAGSVVLPLHNPIRVAEDWAVVDNLSSGRVDLAFARGWNPNDFVLAPQHYQNALQVLYQNLETVRDLWRGNSVVVPNGKGEETRMRIYPQPQQRELPVWITCSGGDERFIEAGKGGWNILTALLFQSVDELARKIGAYREARSKSGYDPDQGHVTLMLHTFVGMNQDEVKRIVRRPFIEYLKTSTDLWRHGSKAISEMTDEERQNALDFAFERYYRTSGLFGTPETCLEMVEQLQDAGVDEIACLIDFGVDVDTTLNGLYSLTWLQERVKVNGFSKNKPAASAASSEARQVQAHRSGMISEKAVRESHVDSILDAKSLRATAVNWNDDENQELLRLVKKVIVAAIAREIRGAPEAIASDLHFLSLGVNSLSALQIIGSIEQQFDLTVPQSMLFEFSTVDSLSQALVRIHRDQLMGRLQKSG